MEKVRPWCGQPSDRGRLKNRTDIRPFRIDLTWNKKRGANQSDVIKTAYCRTKSIQSSLTKT